MTSETKFLPRFKGRGKNVRPVCPNCGEDMKRSYVYHWDNGKKKGLYVANGWECHYCRVKQWD